MINTLITQDCETYKVMKYLSNMIIYDGIDQNSITSISVNIEGTLSVELWAKHGIFRQ